MATYFSDHFSADENGNTAADSERRAPAGINHGRLRIKRAKIIGTITTADTVRLMQFKSGDRLYNLKLTVNGDLTTGAANFGLYKSGDAHDGAVVDADLFATAQSLTSALDETDILDEASLTADNRGDELFVMAGQTEDPMEDWDLVMTPTANFDTSEEVTVTAVYTSGD